MFTWFSSKKKILHNVCLSVCLSKIYYLCIFVNLYVLSLLSFFSVSKSFYFYFKKTEIQIQIRNNDKDYFFHPRLTPTLPTLNIVLEWNIPNICTHQKLPLQYLPDHCHTNVQGDPLPNYRMTLEIVSSEIITRFSYKNSM